jgi:DNA-binding transcriptional ArsR family regulator
MDQSQDTFQILAEPSRRVLLKALLAGELPVNTLVELSGMSQPVVSKHLKILREAGLVDVRPSGQRRLYSLRPEPLRDLDDWLQPYRQYWSDRLDALESHLAAASPRSGDAKSKGGGRNER